MFPVTILRKFYTCLIHTWFYKVFSTYNIKNISVSLKYQYGKVELCHIGIYSDLSN